jgi:23S rRNA (adenine2503-C2)-methyltransferase
MEIECAVFAREATRNFRAFTGQSISPVPQPRLGFAEKHCVDPPVFALADHTIATLEAQLVAWGYKPSHAGRILRAHYAGTEVDWEKLRLPEPLREKIQRETQPPSSLAARQVSDDGTAKLLLRMTDGRTVETVLMPDYRDDRAAGCISSQVGCAMGCDFCATTKTGFERNLTAGEIVEQFLALRREALGTGRRLQTVVFMGMGEPMLNLDAVLEAVRRIADNNLGALGWRQVTVSTVGIVPGINALATADLNVHLAVSLHAPDDATREKLIPAGRRFGIEEIMAAADRYQEKTGRPVTIQYCLLKGVNDSPAQARQLAALLANRRMHVNLLRYNPTGLSLRGHSYEPSPEETAEAFVSVLQTNGLVAHFRRPRGRDIDAACGQLRKRLA